jgi:hypothetical protein
MKSLNSLIKKLARPKLLLILLFLALLGVEAYLLYYQVYGNLSTGIENVSVDNSVRLDLSNYKTTLDLLDSNSTYLPPGLVTNNPFK